MISRAKKIANRIISLALIMLLSLSSALAAQIIIDNDVNTEQDRFRKPMLAFISDQVGYTVFVRDSDSQFAYRKTTDGGKTWPTIVHILTGVSNIGGVMWYQRWTPGLGGNDIHILTGSTSDLYYTKLNTSNDTFTTPIVIDQALPARGFSRATRFSLTESTTGVLYAAIAVSSGDPIMLRCSSNCSSSGTNWTVAGINNPLAASSGAEIKLAPLANGKILGVLWNVHSSRIDYAVYDPATNTWSAKAFLATAIYDSKYRDAWGLVPSPTTPNTVYIVFNSEVDDNDSILKTAVFNGSTWTFKGSIASPDTYTCDIFVDTNSYDFYITKVVDTSSSGSAPHKIAMHKSTDMMQSWSAASNVTHLNSERYRNVGMNMSSTERVYTWFFNDDSDKQLWGANLADLIPVLDPINRNQSIGNWFGIAP